MTPAQWTDADLPDLSGLRAVVTGANAGLGFQTALALARHGAHVVLACRDPHRGDEALGQVRVQAPGASAELRPLDLADLASVRAFAAGLTADGARLDALVNNAGVMGLPYRTTADGFEMQFGTNHLGHFALTGLLLPALLKGSVLGGPARVVSVSSALHRIVRIDRHDLMGERRYRRWRAYATSKLATLLFTGELQRRAEVAGASLAALAAHPGYAATGLLSSASPTPGRGLPGRIEGLLIGVGNRLFAQPAAHGAWPILRAAGDPGARGGEFYGPGGFAEQRGHPTVVQPAAAARDRDDARWLWERSAQLTGVAYAELTPQPADSQE